MFRSIIKLSPENMMPAYFFCILKIAPDYEHNELGIGDSLILEALEKSTGRTKK